MIHVVNSTQMKCLVCSRDLIEKALAIKAVCRSLTSIVILELHEDFPFITTDSDVFTWSSVIEKVGMF